MPRSTRRPSLHTHSQIGGISQVWETARMCFNQRPRCYTFDLFNGKKKKVKFAPFRDGLMSQKPKWSDITGVDQNVALIGSECLGFSCSRKTPLIVPHPQLQKIRPFLRGSIWVTPNLVPPSEEQTLGTLWSLMLPMWVKASVVVPSVGLGFSQPGYMCFVGFEIAFDGVTQGFLWGRGRLTWALYNQW